MRRIVTSLLLFAGTACAQRYLISTVAGGAPQATPLPALTASFGQIAGLTADKTGNVYFVTGNSVFKVDQKGDLTLVAGNSREGYSGDGGPATRAQLSLPQGIALDGSGNLYIADQGNFRVRRVAANGIITTVAGNGIDGRSGDGGATTNATMGYPYAVAADTSGDLFIADWENNVVRKVSADGIISAFAGNGTVGFSGDGGSAVSAQLDQPESLAIDGSGNVFIGDSGNYRIRKVTPNGVITTIAGSGTNGFSGDGGPAAIAQIGFVQGLTFDRAGNLLFADQGNNRVRRISPGGMITTVAGVGTVGFSGDAGPAIAAQLSGPVGVAVDGAGNLLIADGKVNFGLLVLLAAERAGVHLRKVSPSGIINTIAGTGSDGFSGDGGLATNAHLPYVNAFPAADAAGNLYFGTSHRVLKVSSTTGIISTVAGTGTRGFSGDGGPARLAQLSDVSAVAIDDSGNLYIADQTNDVIRKVDVNGTITTIAGSGTLGFSGDGGQAASAQLDFPGAVAVDGSGNVYIADQSCRIRKVTAQGIIETVAGNGTAGYSGDGGMAINAELSCLNPGLAADKAGNVYVADTENQRIRKVSTNGIITTVAGTGMIGTPSDGVPAAGASLFNPYAVTVDAAENLYFTDGFASIRKVSGSGIITTLTGVTRAAGYSGDGGFASTEEFNFLSGIAVDGAGDIFVGDSLDSAFRKLTPTSQTVVISAVTDAASESAEPVSPGKIIVIYGGGMGPSQGVTATPSNGVFGTQLAGTTVTVNGIAAPVFYASDTQVNAIVPYEISGTTANIVVAYAGGVSAAFPVPVAASSPGLFSASGTGAGQAAVINDVDGTVNSAANPAKIGAYISLYATGEGQTTPAGIDGRLATVPLPAPNLPVTVTVDGLPAVVQYRGAAPGAVAGLMQVNVQIPAGVTPGGYVPVVLTVGDAATVDGAIWIAVSKE